MKKLELANQTALVTGASSGLGVDFARQLASRGANLILIARREERLHAVAAEIEKDYGISTQVIALDLSLPDAPQTLYNQIHQQGLQVDILVNNAGFGIYGDFSSIPWEREKVMLDLDIVAVTHMTRLFMQDMLARHSGYILLIASIAAYQPTPTYTTYAAAKAYILSMGEALNYELRNSGVSVTVLSPGITATNFFNVAGQSSTFYQRLTMMDSPTVTRIGINSLLRRRSSVVPGFWNSFIAWGTRLVSRRFQAAVANLLMSGK